MYSIVISIESPNSSKIKKEVLILSFSRYLYSNVSVTLGSISWIEVSIEHKMTEDLI